MDSEVVDVAELVGWLVGSTRSKVGSPAAFNVIVGIFVDNPMGGSTPGEGGGRMPGPDDILEEKKERKEKKGCGFSDIPIILGIIIASPPVSPPSL